MFLSSRQCFCSIYFNGPGGHINPAVTFGLFLARKVTLVRAVMYMVAQCLGAICGVALVKSFQSSYYTRYGGGANGLTHGYSIGTGVAAEIIGTFVLVYTVFSATDPKRSARDSHVPVSSLFPFCLVSYDDVIMRVSWLGHFEIHRINGIRRISVSYTAIRPTMIPSKR